MRDTKIMSQSCEDWLNKAEAMSEYERRAFLASREDVLAYQYLREVREHEELVRVERSKPTSAHQRGEL